MILDTILAKKLEHLEEDLQTLRPTKHGHIATTIKQSKELYILGEIKKASPSKGVIVEDFSIERFAQNYKEAGIDALSVLSEQDFFQGRTEYVTKAKELFQGPVLRKDFIMDVREILQTKQIGADLILLIVAMLDDVQLKVFYECARAIGLECIVEVHNEEELSRALAIQPEIIGINNRNLHTFDVSLDTTKLLACKIPDSIAIISESGIFTHRDITFVKECGVDGVLIGESFMRSHNFQQHLKELRYGKD